MRPQEAILSFSPYWGKTVSVMFSLFSFLNLTFDWFNSFFSWRSLNSWTVPNRSLIFFSLRTNEVVTLGFKPDCSLLFAAVDKGIGVRVFFLIWWWASPLFFYFFLLTRDLLTILFLLLPSFRLLGKRELQLVCFRCASFFSFIQKRELPCCVLFFEPVVGPLLSFCSPF